MYICKAEKKEKKKRKKKKELVQKNECATREKTHQPISR